MDDFRLKVFIAAARTLSFTRTAEQLCISQPAVSKHIGELESHYRVQLFNRRGSRLELTDAGRTLLDAAERILDDYRRMEYEVSLCTRQPLTAAAIRTALRTGAPSEGRLRSASRRRADPRRPARRIAPRRNLLRVSS